METATANAATASPASFVEMTEVWSGNAVLRLWWNTGNGGIHAEIYDAGYPGVILVAIFDATSHHLTTQSESAAEHE